jgi:predicted ATPase/DNA-binding SARP family transcriptional activator
MLFRVLGPLEVRTDGGHVLLGGARSRALLTALLLTPRELVPVHRLAQALWPEDEPGNVDNAVHSAVSRLRRALGSAGELVVTRPPGYLLDATRGSVDAEVFEERLRAAGAAHDATAAVAELDDALALWRGPAYGEFADGFARAAATRLEELRIAAWEDRADALRRAGALAEAAAAALDLAAAHPLRERPVEVAMGALAAAGRASEALATYQRHRDHVRDELGLDPSPGLRGVHARVLRAELPAPAASQQAPKARPRLPRVPSPIIGRAEELAELATALATRPLVTLVGPGGVGKTRTALELAHRAAGRGRPVWWVDLVPVTRERIVEAVAGAAGIGLGPGEDAVDDLRRGLARRRGLLVLDNAEHLLGPLAELVERLLDGPAGLTVFVTSRERLAVDAETVRLLAPLPLPDHGDADNPAVRLFVERAGPGSFDAADLDLVARACRHLDGLPLAIELGAARAQALGLPLLLERLGGRLDLLAGGRRTADRRHRTLRAVVEWSSDLLTADEAALFARLAVFPAAFRLNQAEAVCADEHLAAVAVAPLLARLVEQSLLRRVGERFTLLETLRAYAGERLDDTGTRDALRRRHAVDTAYRLTMQTARLWTKEEAAAVAALTELVEDLHAAFRFAAEHDRPLAVRLAGDVHDFAYIRQRLDLLAWGTVVAGWDDDDEGETAGARSRALATAAVAAWSKGRLDMAAAHVTRAVAVAGGPRAPGTSLAHKVCADLAMFAGRTDEAAQRYRELAASWRAAGEPAQALLFEFAAAQSLTIVGRTAEAAAAVDRLLAPALATGNPTLACWAHYVCGLVAAGDDPQRALAHYNVAVEHGAVVDCRLFVNLAHIYAAAATARLAPETALAAFEDALDRSSRLGNELVQWSVLGQLAVLLAELGADADAATLAGAVLAAGEHHPRFRAEATRLDEAVAVVRMRWGAGPTDSALDAGAALGLPEAVAHARRAITGAARQDCTSGTFGQ